MMMLVLVGTVADWPSLVLQNRLALNASDREGKVLSGCLLEYLQY